MNDNDSLKGEFEFEFTPENIALIKRLAHEALESGLVPQRNKAASDYIDSLLPA